MWPGHLAPDDPDLGAAHLLLAPVDIRNLLAEVEAASRVNSPVFPHAMFGSSNVLGSRGVIDALDLDQARLGGERVAATLVAQVATPKGKHRRQSLDSIGGRFWGGSSRVERGSIAFRVADGRAFGLSPGFELT
jgi:hypothetical protein